MANPFRIAFVFAARPVYGRFPYREHPLKELILRYGMWVRDIAEGVAEEGFQVEVHVPMFFTDTLEVNNVRWHFHRSFYLHSTRFGWEVVPGLFPALILSRPQVIHIHGLGWLPLAFWVATWARLLRKPVVLHHHGEPLFGRSARFEKLLAYTVKMASAVICLTPSIAEELKKRYGITPFLLPAYVNPVFSPGSTFPPDEKPVLVSPGEVIPGKGHHTAARAFKRLLKVFPNAQLLIPGPLSDHSYAANLEKISPKVKFLGTLSRKELARLYRTVHVGVFPSRSEGLGLAALELMATGCPALLSDIPAFRYLSQYSEGVSLFPKDDDQRLFELLRSCLENWTTWREKALAGAERIQEVFGARKYFNSLKELYLSLRT